MFSNQFSLAFIYTVDAREEQFPMDILEPELSMIYPQFWTFYIFP